MSCWRWDGGVDVVVDDGAGRLLAELLLLPLLLLPVVVRVAVLVAVLVVVVEE